MVMVSIHPRTSPALEFSVGAVRDFAPRDPERKDATGIRSWSFAHAPESHGYQPVDEWLSVRGSAPRNPVRQEAAAVKPWSFTSSKPLYMSD